MYIHPSIKMFDFHGGTQRCSNIRMTCIDLRSQITSNPVILGIVKRYQIPFPELQPFQVSTPLSLPMPQEKIMLADQEIQELLGEGAIKLSTPSQNQYLGSVSLVPEKDVSHHPEINLKQRILYVHFEMGRDCSF